MFVEPIDVSIKISRFRIGAGTASGFVDLPVAVNRKKAREEPLFQFFTSSFRGILRDSVLKALASMKDHVSLDSLELHPIITSLFGTWITRGGEEKEEGKLEITFLDFEPKHLQKAVLHGIRMNPRFGSVSRQALFDYEYFLPLTSSIPPTFTLFFRIIPRIPLMEEEAAFLRAGLHGLRWQAFGGFKSRGLGTILEVQVLTDKFLAATTPVHEKMLRIE